MAVRHSVFVVGDAGTGKSQVRHFSLINREGETLLNFLTQALNVRLLYLNRY